MPDRPDLDTLERLLEEATPGPWEYDSGTLPDGSPGAFPFVYVPADSGHLLLVEVNLGTYADAALIAAAVNALPALLADARKVETLLAEREADQAEIVRQQEMWTEQSLVISDFARKVETLREALRVARADVVNMAGAGWDSTRGPIALSSIARIDAALEGERDGR